jgi:hypothetical protein
MDVMKVMDVMKRHLITFITFITLQPTHTRAFR